MKKVLISTLLIGLAGCASAPPTHYWTLQAASATTTPSNAARCTLMLRPIDVPVEFDRESIVTQGEGQQLRWRDDQRWAAPLPRLMEARLAAALRLALPDRNVLTWSVALAGQTQGEIGLTLTHFGAQLGGEVSLQADWIVKQRPNRQWRGRLAAQQPVADRQYAALVDATGRLVDAVATQLADQIRHSPVCSPV
jgi:hypothetical protein